jgi:hypothetical protein
MSVYISYESLVRFPLSLANIMLYLLLVRILVYKLHVAACKYKLLDFAGAFCNTYHTDLFSSPCFQALISYPTPKIGLLLRYH